MRTHAYFGNQRARLAATLALVMSLTAASLCDDAAAQANSIILQSTTSTANSGLYEHILPAFTRASGIRVNVVAVGTGQAIKNARNGDGDVLLVHAKAAEQRFVADGFGVARFDVMYNDFIIVGPPADPAGIAGLRDVSEALRNIAASNAVFASRGDNSGTHKKELELWREARIDAEAHSGKWYRETGSGMGTTLNIAVEMRAYVLTDRATWLSFRNKRDYVVVVEGAETLFNQYGVILVNPARHPTVKSRSGQAFIDWLLGPNGQAAIANYKLNGRQLFFPNAN